MHSFKGKIMSCTDAPDPSNIKWENFTLNNKNRILRKILSFAITFLILITSILFFLFQTIIILAFAFIVYIKNIKQNILDSLPQNVDCSKFGEITEQQVVKEYQSSIKTGLIGCYCGKELSRISHKFADTNDELICWDWYRNDSLYKSLPYIIIFVIIFINIVLQITFKSIFFFFFRFLFFK